MHSQAVKEEIKTMWFAHSGNRPDKTDWQSIQSHLLQVAQLSSERAEVFGAKDFGYLIGLLHDLGKYTPEFQRRLEGSHQKTDHATAGAKEVVRHLENLYGNKKEVHAFAKLLAFPIAGHHAGLANGEEEGKERSPLMQGRGLKHDLLL